MPNKPKRFCLKDGCSNKVKSGYCKEHRQKRRYTDNRESSSMRGYDAKWRKIRDKIVRENPICTVCFNMKTEDVHHIPRYVPGTPHSNYRLIPCCKGCHAKLNKELDK